MALQPTKRGAWCRADRKKSYRLGDLSLLICRLTKEGMVGEVVGGGFRGADRGERTWAARLVWGEEYAVVALCLCNSPVAAEATQVRQGIGLKK